MPEAYNSIHTGEQIDEGISVILNNDIPNIVAEAQKYANDSKNSATDSAKSATNSDASASQSATHATTSENFSKTSESFAKGGTGTRPGEDTDNAKYYSELAAGSAGGIVGALTFNGRSGNVMPEKGDYGVAQGVPILDETNKVPKELLPELGADIPRSPTPPTDPDTKLYIDTSLANDDFYTASETDTKIADAISALPTIEPGINHNFIVNPWFQVLQTPCVYNEVRDRWYYGYNNKPHSISLPDQIYSSDGIKLSRKNPVIKEFICTELLIQKIKFPSDKLTVSARYTDVKGTEKTTSFTFDSNLAYDTPIRSGGSSYIQFQIIKKIWQPLDPNLSALTYDKYLVYFKIRAVHDGDYIIIHNVKLELGSNSTINQDVPLSYVEDLMQCQRFRMIYNNSQIFGVATTAQTGWLTLPLKTSLIMVPNAQDITIPKIYFANGKTLESGYEIKYDEHTALKMDDTSVSYPIRFNPSLSTSDFVPFCCINTTLSLTTFSYPSTGTEYVFPDNPT